MALRAIKNENRVS